MKAKLARPMKDEQPHLSHPKYRPDIDGLRAVSVLAVVAFHTFPSWLKGGFIGVDVFFVISGYLISTIIFENLDRGTFSFTEFYARRVKRIFPALLLVLIACFAFGWFFLLADEYKQLGKHIAGGASFISNFILLNEAGYFDNSVETKPLLHLWSLGIEEQFYIIWPLLLWFAWKCKFNLLTIVIVGAATSFILNIKGIKQDMVSTFYSPQTRFWELLSGSLLAWVTLYKKDAFANVRHKLEYLLSRIVFNEKKEADGKTLSNVLSFFGLFLLAYGFWRINKELSFPGKWSLVPVLGAALIITAGSKAWVNRTILSNKISVWFGLISFPLYLWHWPLLSFARIFEGEVPSRSIRIAVIMLSIALAWVTYKLVECPVRLGKHSKSNVGVLVILMSVMGCVGLNSYQRDGLLFRSFVRETQLNISQLEWQYDKSIGCEKKLGIASQFCLELGNKENETIAVIGDSTANAIAPGLYSEFLSNSNEGLINFGVGTCPPIRGLIGNNKWGFSDSILAPNCPNVMEKVYEYIFNNIDIKVVVLVIFARDLQTWGLGDFQQEDLSARMIRVKALLNKDIAELKRHGKKIIVSFDMPAYPIDAHSCLRKNCEIKADQIIAREPYLSLFNDYFNELSNVCVVNSENVLIKNDLAPFFDEKGILMLRDNHHLSYNGSMVVAKEFRNQGCL